MEQNRPRKKMKRPVKKPWIQRNMKSLAIAFLVLFFMQSIRGCVRSSSYERMLVADRAAADSTILSRDDMIDKRDSVIAVKEDYIQYLEYELKLAGVKVQAAEDRAKAVQETAEKVKNNTTTTIEIKTDTTRNSVIKKDSIK